MTCSVKTDKIEAVLWNLFLQIVSGILGLWLADKYVPGVDFNGLFFIVPKAGMDWNALLNTLVFVGGLLGVLNYFVKPILNTIALPLRIISLNLFSFVIMMFLVWLADVFSPELVIKGLKPLFFAALLVWAIHFILSGWMPGKSLSLFKK